MTPTTPYNELLKDLETSSASEAHVLADFIKDGFQDLSGHAKERAIVASLKEMRNWINESIHRLGIEEEKTVEIVAAGFLGDGYTFIGPFEDAEQAMRYVERALDVDGQVLTMNLPDWE